MSRSSGSRILKITLAQYWEVQTRTNPELVRGFPSGPLDRLSNLGPGGTSNAEL